MNKELSKRFSEAYEILKYLPREYFCKIPSNVIKYISEHKDNKYIWHIDKTKKLYEQNLNVDTVAILSYINMEYLVNEQQQHYLKKLYLYNDNKFNLSNSNTIQINELFPKKDIIKPNEQLAEYKKVGIVKGTIMKLIRFFYRK